MRLLLWIQVALSAAALPLAAQSVPADLLGLRHPPLPQGFTDLGGWLLGSTEHPRYAIAWLRQGSRDFAVLDSLVAMREGSPEWVVLDIVPLPRMGDTLGLVSTCTLAGSTHGNGDLIAAVRWTGGAILPVRRAWEIDRANGRLRALSPRAVTCANDGLEG